MHHIVAWYSPIVSKKRGQFISPIHTLVITGGKCAVWDPESGQMVAVMHWKEYIGDQFWELRRQVVLTVFVRPGENSTTEVFFGVGCCIAAQ